MDFSLPKEYEDFRKKVCDFAANELNDDILSRDYNGEFSYELWRKCGEFGLLGLASEPEYGGTHKSIDLLRASNAMLGFGYGCPDAGLGLAMNAHLWTVQMTISKFGTEAQKKKFLPKMTSGEWIGAHGLSEDESGSDVYSLKTTASKVEGGFLLNGQKRLVTLAPICDLAVVFVNANPELGKWGITAMIVENGMQGFTRMPNQDKMGLRTVPIGRLHFDDCFIPEENVLGSVGSGWSISNWSLEYDRCCILSCNLGAMERQLDRAVEYARTRKQFGQSIGSFQAISHRLADMKSRIEIAKTLTFKLAWMKQNDKDTMLDSAILKLFLSESFVASSLDVIRIFGGSGYLSENGIERDLRDAVGGVIYAGTTDIQKNIIAGHLGI